MLAICPKCRCQLPEIGFCCENDGWYGVNPEELEYPDTVVGRPLGNGFYALKRIGQGGMGTVYEGRQILFNRTVAIKVLSNVHLNDKLVFERFEREAKSIARVMHPNVVKLIDSGIEDGTIAYIVMEYVSGVELSSVHPSDITGQFIVQVAYQVLNALSEAHAMNVIHRDLKPDNIMVTQEDGHAMCVKVLDFGLAALTDRAKITVSGQALGTPWYMSPEQATASAVTCASDIYSLGCILYELATSKPPFPGNRPFNVMMQHVNAQVPPLVVRPEAELSREMIRFIMKCLEKNPANRYVTADLALEALQKVPEWAVAGQVDSNQSFIQSMKALSEMASARSDIISELSDAIKSGENISIRRPSCEFSTKYGAHTDTASGDWGLHADRGRLGADAEEGHSGRNLVLSSGETMPLGGQNRKSGMQEARPKKSVYDNFKFWLAVMIFVILLLFFAIGIVLFVF